MKKIIYVTGCLGFIGAHITRSALKNGWYVHGIDKITYAANTNLLDEFLSFETFKFSKIDINDVEYIHDCDYFVNTAAETHVDNSISFSDSFIHSNVKGVHHLLEVLRLNRYSKPTFLHFSTDEVYGDIQDSKFTELDMLNPSNPYAATKASADMLVKAWSRTYEIPYIIVRPTNNYGIGQHPEKLIPKSCKNLMFGRKIPLHENGSPIRTWLHVQDTADAITFIIEKGIQNEIFNISSHYEQTNLETVSKIIEAFRLNSPELNEKDIKDFINFNVTRIGQDVRYAVDDSKLRSYGWSPKKEFDEEILNIVNYYKNNFGW